MKDLSLTVDGELTAYHTRNGITIDIAGHEAVLSKEETRRLFRWVLGVVEEQYLQEALERMAG